MAVVEKKDIAQSADAMEIKEKIVKVKVEVELVDSLFSNVVAIN